MPRWGDPEDDWDDEEDEFDGDDPDDDDTIPCPRCGRSIFDESERCPHCGRYLSLEDAPPRRRPWWWILGFIAALYVVLRWVFWF